MPLRPMANNILKIPFYSLESHLDTLDTEQTYLLYCAQNVMSRLQAHSMRRLWFQKGSYFKAQSLKITHCVNYFTTLINKSFYYQYLE